MDVEMNVSHRSLHRQSGMSLIEVLVSLLVFSFGVLGMVGLQAQASKFSTDSEDRMRAVMCANEIVSAMWAQQTMSLSQSTVDGYVAASGLGNVSNPATGSITLSTADTVPIATVTIQWTSPARVDPVTHLAELSTYKTQVAMP